MFLKGYRPFTQYKHVAVVKFVESVFEKQLSKGLVYVFDKMRRKRHRVVYEEVGIVSEKEAAQVVEWASEFVEKVRTTLVQ